MHKVRTTMEPDRELEVSDQEYLDLKRQNLLAEEPTPEPTPEPQGLPEHVDRELEAKPTTRTRTPKGEAQ